MMFHCEACGKNFSRKDLLKRHERTHDPNRDKQLCAECGVSFTRIDNLAAHKRKQHGIDQFEEPPSKRAKQNQSEPTVWRPWTGSAINHPRKPVKGLNANLVWRPWESEKSSDCSEIQNAKNELPGGLEERIEKVITANQQNIASYRRVSKRRLQDRYNYEMRCPTSRNIKACVEDIYKDQKSCFKLNFSFGFVLMHKLTEQLCYYYASQNNRVFDKPLAVSNKAGLAQFVSKFEGLDVLEYCRQQRPNSSYIVVAVTNILFYVNKLEPMLMGAPADIPQHVKNNRGILSLDRDYRGYLYKDNLCLLRCLAIYRGSTVRTVDTALADIKERWFAYIGEHTRHGPFNGVPMNRLTDFEDAFSVNVVGLALEYEDNEDENGLPTDPILCVHEVVKSRMKYKDTMYTHVFKNHFSLITNMHKMCRNWQCGKCDKMFCYYNRMLTHSRSCSGQTSFKYKGGGFGRRKTVFDHLRDNGIAVDRELTFYPFRISYDFEAVLKPLDAEVFKGAQKFLKPASVSICSNVPGFTQPQCIVSTGDDSELVHRMMTKLEEISDKAYATMLAKMKPVTDQLDRLIKKRKDLQELPQTPAHEEEIHRLKVYEDLNTQLCGWLRQIVVLGFNSAKFDMNLVRTLLFPYLLENGIQIKGIIKKGNAYLSVSLDKLVFLDVINYLAPNTSYAKWLKAYGVDQGKGCFPYEWLQDLRDLETPYLVGKEKFFSTLKQRGISDQEYQEVQQTWKRNGFQTMRDLLVWYNNLDVLPFQEAALRMWEYWKTLEIDPFKGGAISLPGLALIHLMRTLPKHTVLPLFGEQHKDVHDLITSNISGGLSGVIHRYHEVDVTTLPNGQKVKQISSRDANGLYLYALAEDQGTGMFYLWRPTGNCCDMPVTTTDMSPNDIREWMSNQHTNLNVQYKRVPAYPYRVKELEWLEWYAHETNTIVQHFFNGGQRTIVRSKDIAYPVDGFVVSTNTVLQFHGCYWHGHACGKNPNILTERRMATREVTGQIRKLGFKVIEMWECEWDKLKDDNASIRRFLDEHVRPAKQPSMLSGKQLLKKIESGHIFGLVECDVEVPAWNKELREYFKDFPPVYKNVEIGRDDIGEFMEAYAEQNGLLKKPQKALISSYWGRKILLTTDLLCWYLTKGLVVGRVYQMIEMKPKRCFEHLKEEVSFHRRQADTNPAYKPIGENWKLTGNNYYGKTATNKRKHKKTEITDNCGAKRLLNSSRFNQLEDLGTCYEVTCDKKSIVFDLPITVAFFVYMTSKRRMLEFVYDFLAKFLKPGSYQMICTDTDSIVAAYADSNIDNLVRDDMRMEYHSRGKQAFLVTDKYSERTPGLFKVEAEGRGAVALCSKTYIIWGDDYQKLSSKGLSKVTNSFKKEDYLNVLETGVRGSGINRGFKITGSGIYQYEQQRRGLSYLYTKRKVQSDGISTLPLDL